MGAWRLPATWCAFTAVLVLPGATRAQTPPAPTPLTLSAALTRAREHNPAIAAARLGHAVATAGIAVARERPNPDVTYEASRDTPRQSIGVSLPLELGGQRTARIGLAEAGVKVADADLAVTIAEVEDEVRRAYFALVVAEARAVLARGSRDLAGRARDAASARLAAGDAPRLESIQAELIFADADNAVSTADGEATAARMTLNVLLGDAPDAPVALADQATATPLPALADAMALASGSNTGLVALDRRIDAQIAQRRVTSALSFPDVNVGSALTYDAEPDFKAGWRLDFGATLPLFTRRAHHVLVEDATLQRLRAERAAAATTLTGTVAAALARATAAREAVVRYQTDILPRVADVERMAQDAYSSGQSNLAALLQSLTAAREIRARAVDANLDYQTGLADLERALGGPLAPGTP